MVWIYIWQQQRGRRGTCTWAVAEAGVNGSRQEQEEAMFESAGELMVTKEMRGCAER